MVALEAAIRRPVVGELSWIKCRKVRSATGPVRWSSSSVLPSWHATPGWGGCWSVQRNRRAVLSLAGGAKPPETIERLRSADRTDIAPRPIRGIAGAGQRTSLARAVDRAIVGQDLRHRHLPS